MTRTKSRLGSRRKSQALTAANQQFTIDPIQEGALGKYVYALVDPRDRQIFYIGQGQKIRAGDHFKEARKAIAGHLDLTLKRKRIIAIWASGKAVEIVVLRRNLRTDGEADNVEGACITALRFSPNGPVTNANVGTKSLLHGSMTSAELRAEAAPPVNPKRSYPCVFVFSIRKTWPLYEDAYEATRASWQVSDAWSMQRPAFAVGILDGVSIGAFSIKSWRKRSDGRRAFVKSDTSVKELELKDWSVIIGGRFPNAWVYGRHLIVEFDGRQRFRILDGAADKRWRELVPKTKLKRRKPNPSRSKSATSRRQRRA